MIVANHLPLFYRHTQAGNCPNKKAIEERSLPSGMAGNEWLACVSGSCKFNRTVPNIYYLDLFSKEKK